jgi:5'-nucleotidase
MCSLANIAQSFGEQTMRRSYIAVLAGTLVSISACTIATNAPRTIDVTVLAVNDFHGNLMPPVGGITITDPADATKTISIPAGGAETMGTLVKQERAKHPNTIFVAAGDLIGASPLLSGLFHDEPTVEALSAMGLEVAAVGNHEFDEGTAELKRMQNGGCHPVDGCKGPHPFTGAKYHYLAASTIETATGQTLFPPYYIKTFGTVSVAFIGLTLKGTPDVVTPSGVAGLVFKDEAETVNALVPELRKRGIEAIVVLIHEGGTPMNNSTNYNACPGISGHIVDIVPKLDKAVDAVVSGHTHEAYNCVIDGRVVTSAHRFGTLLTEIDLKLDSRTRDVVAVHAENLIVRSGDLPKDPDQTQMIAAYQALAAHIAGRVSGTITEALSRDPNAAGEAPLGDVLADAELAAAQTPGQGAMIGFINVGGLRSSLAKRTDGAVTYADLFAVQPFGNILVTETMTGAQIKTALEEQWSDLATPHIMQVSKGFSYTWDDKQPSGNRVVARSITLNGTPVSPEVSYRVAIPQFLADGGDGLIVFRDGQDRRPVIPDLDATELYFKANSPVAPPPGNRIQRRN